MNKYRPELTDAEKTELERLSQLDFSTFSEADVREEYIVPLLVVLGYRKNQDYSVSREDTFKLGDVYLMVGSKNVRLDYLFSVRKQFFWLIDAKAGTGEKDLSEDSVYQAYFYSQLPQIDAIYFAVCNGWNLNLFERDRIENSLKPILSIASHDIAARFLELDRFLGATQILPMLKKELLKRTKKILSAEVALERLSEYMSATQAIIREVEPTVLTNFRENSKRVEASRKKEHEDYLKSARPYDIVDSLFLTSITLSEIDQASRLLYESQDFKTGHSNHYLLFHKILLEELRPVNYWYYINSLNFLVLLKREGVTEVDYPFNGKPKGRIDEILNYWLLGIYTFFQDRKELRLISLFEGLNYRFLKFFLIMSSLTKDHILNRVKAKQFLLPEEQIAWLGPNPARELIDLVTNTTFTSLGKFIDTYYDRNKRHFKQNLAREHYSNLQSQMQQAKTTYGQKYRDVLGELGSSWSELLFLDGIYDRWNPVVSAASEILIHEDQIVSELSPEVKEAIAHANALGISTFTSDLCNKFGIRTKVLTDQEKIAGIEAMYSVE